MMEPDLLAQMIERHAAALVLYARQWCASADDVVQEAFVKLSAQRPAPNNLAGWLYRVVRNGAISAGRSEQRRRVHETQACRQRTSWFQPSAETALDGAEAALALQTLPLEQREIIVAHLWGGLTFAQIAQLVRSSASTVHRRYVEGLTQLRERLELPCPINTNDPT